MCSARFSLPLLLSPSVALRALYPIAGLQLHNMSLLQPFPLVVRSSASATDRVAVELPPFSVVCANQTMCLFGLEVGPRRQLHSVSLCDALPLERSLSMIPHGPRRTSTVVHRV